MKTIFGLLLLSVVLIGFQNCSRVAFKNVDDGLTKTGFVSGPEVANVVTDQVGDDQVGDDQVGDDQVGDDQVGDDQVGDDQVGDDQVGDDQVGDDQVGDDQVGDDIDPLDVYACHDDKGGSEKKVLICHYPPGKAAKRNTLCIGRSALPAHMSHGGVADTLGACPE